MNKKPKSPMQKFYVQSGNHRLVTLAKSTDEAALRLIQKLFQPAICSLDSRRKLPTMVDEIKLALLLTKPGPKITVSQRGFASPELEFATGVVVKRWRKQMVSLEKLLRKMK